MQKLLEHTDGYVYMVTRMHSDCFFGRFSLYWVRTNNERPNMDEIVRNIIGERTAVSESKYHEINATTPSIYANMLPYYTSNFVPDCAQGHYEITITRRTDD